MSKLSKLQCFALLDRFDSDVNEISLDSVKNRSLRIKKFSKASLKKSVGTLKIKGTAFQDILNTAISVGEDKYWIDYNYELEDSKEAKIRANNTVFQEIEKFLLTLRLFKEGYIRNVFCFWKLPNSWTIYSILKPLRSDERIYFLQSSEVQRLKDFQRHLTCGALEENATQPALDISISRFIDGYERVKLEDRFIDYMIGLEALYLQGEGTSEMTYKLAHRISIFLETEKIERQNLFKKLRILYRLRGNIVHGTKYELEQADVWFLEDKLRLSINKFLETPKLSWEDIIF